MGRHSAHEKLVLVKHQPGVRTKRRMKLILVASLVGIIAYVSGYYQIKNLYEKAVIQLEKVSLDYAALVQSEANLKQQVTNLESGRAIDNLAKQEIQDTIMGLKDEVSLLKKDISFYQNIMAPSDNARGLQVQNVEIGALNQSGRFDYKVVLAQVADNKSYVSGIVAINVIGFKDDKQVVLPLRDISEVAELGIKFRFKYFQDIKGELRLPESFTPQSIQVVAQSKGKKASRLEQSFDWNNVLKTNG